MRHLWRRWNVWLHTWTHLASGGISVKLCIGREQWWIIRRRLRNSPAKKIVRWNTSVNIILDTHLFPVSQNGAPVSSLIRGTEGIVSKCRYQWGEVDVPKLHHNSNNNMRWRIRWQKRVARVCKNRKREEINEKEKRDDEEKRFNTNF